jgi:arylsulfatase A-like enzyme
MLIIAADHGEGFGEHGHIGHGYGLSRELIHVPLIILGPGIPQGRRVSQPVGVRRLYATILGMAKQSVERSSLQNYWSAGPDYQPRPSAVISELDRPFWGPTLNSFISLTTAQWHCILDAHGHAELFDYVRDPGDKVNLAGTAEGNAIVQSLQQVLSKRVKNSPGPWTGLGYLQPLGIKTSQAISAPDRDLLESVPYQ